jgi:hypothetical protein
VRLAGTAEPAPGVVVRLRASSLLTWLTFAGLREMRGIELLLCGFWAEYLRTNRFGERASC